MAPQDPGHGFIHFLLTQARFILQSLLLIHSALQLGGCPVKPGRHEHDAWSLITRQKEFNPHGEDWQGFWVGSIIAARL